MKMLPMFADEGAAFVFLVLFNFERKFAQLN